MDCYFDRNYFTDYFDICSEVVGGGGGLGPSRADLAQAKKWLREEKKPVTLQVHEALEGVSSFVTAFPVERQEPTKFEHVIEQVEKHKPVKVQAFESLPAVTSDSSLSLSWSAAIKRDDEELILFL